VKVKISARSPNDLCSCNFFTQTSGSSTCVSSQTSSWMAASLIHFPVMTIDLPSTSNAGTLTHFPLKLISMVLFIITSLARRLRPQFHVSNTGSAFLECPVESSHCIAEFDARVAENTGVRIESPQEINVLAVLPS